MYCGEWARDECATNWGENSNIQKKWNFPTENEDVKLRMSSVLASKPNNSKSRRVRPNERDSDSPASSAFSFPYKKKPTLPPPKSRVMKPLQVKKEVQRSTYISPSRRLSLPLVVFVATSVSTTTSPILYQRNVHLRFKVWKLWFEFMYSIEKLPWVKGEDGCDQNNSHSFVK